LANQKAVFLNLHRYNAAAPAMSTSSAEMSVDPDPKPAEEDEPVPSDSEGISASVLLTPEVGRCTLTPPDP
jgi:hypothetical protein